MTSEWQLRPLGELCEINPKKRGVQTTIADDQLVSFVPMEDLGVLQRSLVPKRQRQLGEVYKTYTYFAEGDVLLAKITPCFENAKLSVARGLTNGVGFGSSEYMVLRTGPALDPDYLFYFLSRDQFRSAGQATMTGAVGHKRVPPEFVAAQHVPLAPLEEQKRIVAVLDEAFEGLSRVTQNNHLNLSDSCGLLASQLDQLFGTRTRDTRWSLVRLGEICSVRTGKKDVNQGNPNGEFPFFTCARHHTYSDVYSFDGEALLIAGNGEVGNLSHYTGKFEAYQRTYVLMDFVGVLARYLFFVLEAGLKRTLVDQKLGNTMPYIKKGMLTDFEVPLPSFEEQAAVVRELEMLSNCTVRLQAKYTQNVDDLNDLRQSLLQRAFSGKLT